MVFVPSKEHESDGQNRFPLCEMGGQCKGAKLAFKGWFGELATSVTASHSPILGLPSGCPFSFLEPKVADGSREAIVNF